MQLKRSKEQREQNQHCRKAAFKTSNGRTVYDGGGIDPDIKVESVEAHQLTQVLFEKGYLFDYVTQYVIKHTDVPDARAFTLTDEEYNQFVNWMKGKNYQYKSYLEYELQEFTEEARKEKYFAELKTQLEQVNAKILESRKNELIINKDQIKMLLEEDIVSRYHLEKGSIEAGFKYDDDTKKAIEIVHNQSQYKKILNIE